MKITTTLSAFLFTACTIPGFQMGSTLSPSTSNSSTPGQSSTSNSSTPGQPSPASGTDQTSESSPGNDAPDLSEHARTTLWDASSLSFDIANGSYRPGPNSGSEADLRKRFLDPCREAVALDLKRGVEPKTQVKLDHDRVVMLGDADVKLCDVIAKELDGWQARADAAKASAHADLDAPYRKVGVTGEKLAVILGSYNIHGPNLVDVTPQNAARLNTLFTLSSADGQWFLIRYTFRGNTKISETSRAFLIQPGSDQYR